MNYKRLVRSLIFANFPNSWSMRQSWRQITMRMGKIRFKNFIRQFRQSFRLKVEKKSMTISNLSESVIFEDIINFDPSYRKMEHSRTNEAEKRKPSITKTYFKQSSVPNLHSFKALVQGIFRQIPFS